MAGSDTIFQKQGDYEEREEREGSVALQSCASLAPNAKGAQLWRATLRSRLRVLRAFRGHFFLVSLLLEYGIKDATMALPWAGMSPGLWPCAPRSKCMPVHDPAG